MAEFMFQNVVYRATVYRTGPAPIPKFNIRTETKSGLSHRVCWCDFFLAIQCINSSIPNKKNLISFYIATEKSWKSAIPKLFLALQTFVKSAWIFNIHNHIRMIHYLKNKICTEILAELLSNILLSYLLRFLLRSSVFYGAY